MSTATPSKRNSSFELLRILSMFFIVMSHYTTIGVQPWKQNITSLFYSSLPIGGTLGVNCFVFITGYFLLSKDFTLEKLSRLIFQVISFSAIISIIVFFTKYGQEQYSIGAFIKASAGIMGNYWFINSYIALLIFSPFLNSFLRKLEKKEHFYFIIVLITLNYLLPQLRIPTNMGNTCLFVTLYSIAAFFRLYQNSIHISLRSAILSFSALLVLDILLIWSTQVYGFMAILSPFIVGHSSIILLLLSMSFFIIFAKIHINYSRIINYFGASTLGIYLFHEHAFSRTLLWGKILHCPEAPFGDTPYIHCVSAILLVFTAGIVADMIYRHTISYLHTPFFNYIVSPITTTVKRFWKAVTNSAY